MVFGSTRHVLNTIFQASPGRRSEPPARCGPRSAHDGVLCRPAVCDNQPRYSDGRYGQSRRHVPIRHAVVGAGASTVPLGRGGHRGRQLDPGSLPILSGQNVAIQIPHGWYERGRCPIGVLFFLWLFYASLVFVVGAEAGWVFEHRRTLEGAGEQGMT